MIKRKWWALLGAVVVGLAINKCYRDGIQFSLNLDGNDSLFASLRQADRVILYEGLPREHYEEAEYREAFACKDNIDLLGQFFYRQPLEFHDGDLDKLKALLSDRRSYQPFRGEKKCGGFHADFAVEWAVADKVYRCLLCFGCSEAIVAGPDVRLRCDLAAKGEKSLIGILRHYHNQRPITFEQHWRRTEPK